MKNLKKIKVTELDEKSLIAIEGGYDPFGVVIGVIGIMAGAAYLYEFGYNYTKNKLKH
jgi:lactobin A/cerein 7B family class IIb bacteriocin